MTPSEIESWTEYLFHADESHRRDTVITIAREARREALEEALYAADLPVMGGTRREHDAMLNFRASALASIRALINKEVT